MPRLTFTDEGIYLRSHHVACLLKKFPRLTSKEAIELPKLLMGGEEGRSAASYARMTGDLSRPSRPIAESPHAELLRNYRTSGEDVFAPDRFEATPYYRNAAKCIELFGRYFAAQDPKDIIRRARKFCQMLDGKPFEKHEVNENEPGSAPVVQRIRFSDCYEILHGQHRLAVAAVQGLKKYKCVIRPSEPVLTPLQQMIMDSSWTDGRRELYQPISAPEVATWPIVRRCADRLGMMTKWLTASGIGMGSYLDIGCSYGWFGAEMAKRGFDTFGVDRDAAALAVGRLVHRLDNLRYRATDVVAFLDKQERQYDIVSCFSVLHHFALGAMRCSAEDFIHKVDAATGRALFLDTAECHEGWFTENLAEWNADFVGRWLKKNTSFTHVQILGTDADNVGPHRDQYQRHLFVCSRE